MKHHDEANDRRAPEPLGGPDAFRGGELACAGARALLPGLLDGELSAGQSGELTAHLKDCPSCRAVARQEENLRHWFERGHPVAVPAPAGFASRVARRAFAGDPGIVAEDEPVAPAPRGTLLRFLLRASAAAAILLLGLSLLLQRETLPKGEQLEAMDYVPPWERAAADLTTGVAPTDAPAHAAAEAAKRGEKPAEAPESAEGDRDRAGAAGADRPKEGRRRDG